MEVWHFCSYNKLIGCHIIKYIVNHVALNTLLIGLITIMNCTQENVAHKKCTLDCVRCTSKLSKIVAEMLVWCYNNTQFQLILYRLKLKHSFWSMNKTISVTVSTNKSNENDATHWGGHTIYKDSTMCNTHSKRNTRTTVNVPTLNLLPFDALDQLLPKVGDLT